VEKNLEERLMIEQTPWHNHVFKPELKLQRTTDMYQNYLWYPASGKSYEEECVHRATL